MWSCHKLHTNAFSEEADQKHWMCIVSYVEDTGSLVQVQWSLAIQITVDPDVG